MKERIKVLAKKKYCYGCLQPMSDSHNVRTYTRQLSCSSCKGNHPTPLHGYIPKVMKDKADGSQDNSNSENIKYKYAMLDNDVKCASTTAKSGTKVISMCTVPVKINKDHDGERSESTFAIKGVKMTGMHGDSGWLALPKLYSRREIPVDKEEIATPTKIREWNYLQPISNEIVQNDDVRVGLLIGANCMKALEPTRILQSQDGGLYAHKTRLGWYVVGPINCTAKNCSISCSRVAVKDVASSKLGSHHFIVEDSVKDISLEEMFHRM